MKTKLNEFMNTLQGLLEKNAVDRLTSEEAEFLPAVLEVTESPPSPVARIVVWTIVILLIIGALWSIFGHVDEVAIAEGKIIPIGQVKVVQPEDKGVVKQIYVKEGQIVKKGDILVELDPTITAADLARTKKEIAYYSLEIERLLAEKEGRLFSPASGPDVDPKDIEFQVRLYTSRMNDIRSKMAAAEAVIGQNEASAEAAMINREKLSQQLSIARDKESRVESLLQDNAVALFQVLDQRARRMELEQTLLAQESEIARATAAVAQARNNLSSIKTEWNRDIDTKLVEDRKLLAGYSEELKKAEEKNRLSRILAPTSGRVNQLSIHTVGGVVSEAQPLMEIVPEDVELEIEAWVLNKDIGFIQLGQTAEVKVTTFNFQKYGVLDAEITDISPNAVVEKTSKDGQGEAKFRIALKPDKTEVVVGDRKVPLGPGMTVSAEIKIREKRIIEFFLDPFRQYQNEALRER